MSAALFVTGTDTGVGKTAIACGILGALRARGMRVAPLKPAETGCPLDGWPPDGRALAMAAGGGFARDDIVPYALPEPLAPSVAAERAGVSIDLGRLDAAFARLRSRADMVVVEGAGGIAVPLTQDFTMADLAARWDLPVLVVARAGLGTINHSVLTVAHSRARGLRVLGIVINGFPERADDGGTHPRCRTPRRRRGRGSRRDRPHARHRVEAHRPRAHPRTLSRCLMMQTHTSPDWRTLADRVLSGHQTTREEALAILRSSDEELLAVLAAAYRIRRAHFGNKVHLHLLMNAQSGLCPEDCHYCSQSKISVATIEKYSLLPKEVILDGAKRAAELKAATYCIVTSGRGPTDKQVDEVADIVRAIKEQHHLKVCVCMGLLKEGQARKLKDAGVDRYNHNLNTSEAHTSNVVTTHTYADRVHTVEHVKHAGISPCSGAIFGMGESDDDAVDVALTLRALDADSIPVNFLNPIPGTPFANLQRLDPRTCLRILAMVRFVNPTKEIRIAGGRELHLRSLQAMGLYAANSIFIGDYLTTKGQAPEEDYAMIRDLGFQIEDKPETGG